jgi:hypothetical protein
MYSPTNECNGEANSNKMLELDIVRVKRLQQGDLLVDVIVREAMRIMLLRGCTSSRSASASSLCVQCFGNQAVSAYALCLRCAGLPPPSWTAMSLRQQLWSCFLRHPSRCCCGLRHR